MLTGFGVQLELPTLVTEMVAPDSWHENLTARRTYLSSQIEERKAAQRKVTGPWADQLQGARMRMSGCRPMNFERAEVQAYRLA